MGIAQGALQPPEELDPELGIGLGQRGVEGVEGCLGRVFRQVVGGIEQMADTGQIVYKTLTSYNIYDMSWLSGCDRPATDTADAKDTRHLPAPR
ncbi:hypothetical protein [uncultured Thiodictyon sp.]|jgi:hypothetical protein|uniref:hypothetical protein n=1 Tax=uncultured Thiodictyon sp. TaxID=1846217 RepID=UPI0025DDE005|nr:hypothetical protein [uncultured Thiodictyon sp.]